MCATHTYLLFAKRNSATQTQVLLEHKGKKYRTQNYTCCDLHVQLWRIFTWESSFVQFTFEFIYIIKTPNQKVALFIWFLKVDQKKCPWICLSINMLHIIDDVDMEINFFKINLMNLIIWCNIFYLRAWEILTWVSF